MGFLEFFDMSDKKTDIKRLLAFICIVAAIVVGALALLFDKFSVEVGSFAGALLATGVGILGKIVYDIQQDKKDPVP